MKNILSFDLEEYFHGVAYDHIPDHKWHSLESRVIAHTEKLLEILGTRRATFFCVGWVAEKYPEIIKNLHKQGHEIACHSDLHKNIWDLTPDQFRADVLSAKEKLENIIGSKIIGYRAPTFSITKKTYWALDVLSETNFKYDSSIFPIYHDRYGIPDSPRAPYKVNQIWEIPLSAYKFLGLNIPFGGGGYFRMYPYFLTRVFIALTNSQNRPFVFYQHPWELDNKIKTKPKSFFSWLRRHIILGGTTEKKLESLLHHYEFYTISDWLQEQEAKEQKG